MKVDGQTLKELLYYWGLIVELALAILSNLASGSVW